MSFKLGRSSKEPMSEINVNSFCRCYVSSFNYFYGYCTTINCWCASRFYQKLQQIHCQKNRRTLTLTINSKGEIFIQEAKVEFDSLTAKILAVSKNRTDTRIYVRGDKAINYGKFLK